MRRAGTYLYSQQGLGLSLAAGLDLRLVAGVFLRCGVAHVRAGTSDDYDHATPDLGATTLFLAAGYQLGWPPLPGGGATPAAEGPEEPPPAGAEGETPAD